VRQIEFGVDQGAIQIKYEQLLHPSLIRCFSDARPTLFVLRYGLAPRKESGSCIPAVCLDAETNRGTLPKPPP
jgi:hypothetical protein